MLDNTFAVRGRRLTYKGKTFTVKNAGVKEGKPYAEVEPRNSVVERAILQDIDKNKPYSFSLDDVQKNLSK